MGYPLYYFLYAAEYIARFQYLHQCTFDKLKNLDYYAINVWHSSSNGKKARKLRYKKNEELNRLYNGILKKLASA